MQFWCDIDSVLVQYSAITQLLVKQHNISPSLYSCWWHLIVSSQDAGIPEEKTYSTYYGDKSI